MILFEIFLPILIIGLILFGKIELSTKGIKVSLNIVDKTYNLISVNFAKSEKKDNG